MPQPMLIEDGGEQNLVHKSCVTIKHEESANIKSCKSVIKPDSISREEQLSDRIEQRGTPIRVGSEKLFLRPFSALP
jgi:hypothetical protein